MILVDVNLLLYATIKRFPQHEKAKKWWEKTLNGSTQVILTAPAVFGFLRLSTNPRMMVSPLPVEKAIAYVESWLEQSNVHFVPGSFSQLTIAFGLLKNLGTGGNLTTDAQLAALAIESNATLYTNDSDFGKFQGLKWINPLR